MTEPLFSGRLKQQSSEMQQNASFSKGIFSQTAMRCAVQSHLLFPGSENHSK
jgi:hypothetical protein